MQRAKESIQAFISKSGHHDTTVHESVAPAVQHEVVKPHKHEEVTVATDKEVHQDHYHHTVQPVKDREVLPEEHHHNLGAVQHREVDHRDHDSVKRNEAAIAGQFRDEREVRDTTHSQSAAAAVGGEHVHHHIHETIQPVLHKETIQPNVIHTTVPIHEVHHNAAKHHETTELPALSIAEFKNKGGSLHGREEKYDAFEGEPKNVGGILGGHGTHSHSHSHAHHNTTGISNAGVTGTSSHADRTGLKHHGTGSSHSSLSDKVGAEAGLAGGAVQGERRVEERAVDGARPGDVGARRGDHLQEGHEAAVGSGTRTGGLTGETHGAGVGGATRQEPSMMQKLNPFKDADGDGRKGIMD